MPKCSHVVLLIIASNILTLSIYSSVKFDYNSIVSSVSSPSWSQPLPQPFQYSKIQTGRVIQSLNEDQSQEFPTPLPRHNTPEDVRLLFTKRKDHLDHQCEIKKSNPVEPFINDPSHLLVLPDRNVVWCPVFKAGSSTWLSIILDLSSVSKARKLWIENRYQNNPLQQGRAVAPVLTRSSWIRYLSNLRRENITDTSFIVVRHPFERLVSAYRDKIERSHAKNYLTDWYYKQYGQKIVKKYRSQAINLFGPQFFSHYNNYGAPLPVKNKGRPNANLPIFWEFVQFVIHQKKSSMDEHWKPTANYCSMCIINYDYVIKFEDLSQESQEFLKVTNLKQFISDDIWDRHLNPNRPKEMSSEEITAKYFGQLSDDDIHKLYGIYQDDFNLFDYRFNFRNISLPLK